MVEKKRNPCEVKVSFISELDFGLSSTGILGAFRLNPLICFGNVWQINKRFPDWIWDRIDWTQSVDADLSSQLLPSCVRPFFTIGDSGRGIEAKRKKKTSIYVRIFHKKKSRRSFSSSSFFFSFCRFLVLWCLAFAFCRFILYQMTSYLRKYVTALASAKDYVAQWSSDHVFADEALIVPFPTLAIYDPDRKIWSVCIKAWVYSPFQSKSLTSYLPSLPKFIKGGAEKTDKTKSEDTDLKVDDEKKEVAAEVTNKIEKEKVKEALAAEEPDDENENENDVDDIYEDALGNDRFFFGFRSIVRFVFRRRSSRRRRTEGKSRADWVCFSLEIRSKWRRNRSSTVSNIFFNRLTTAASSKSVWSFPRPRSTRSVLTIKRRRSIDNSLTTFKSIRRTTTKNPVKRERFNVQFIFRRPMASASSRTSMIRWKSPTFSANVCCWNTLSNSYFKAVEGMSELYQKWSEQKCQFHYVSASPWQL